MCSKKIQFIQGAKYLWVLPATSNRHIIDISQRYNLSVPIVKTLIARGITDPAAIDSFLHPCFEKNVTHASKMADAQKAVDRIRCAIERREHILIFGDYDVDGMSATALMVYCLHALGAQVNFYLPNRATEGYGLSVAAVDKAAGNGYSLIITVDNGIMAFDAAEQAHRLGVDLIITDHHRPHNVLPRAYAIVNPLRHDCSFPCKTLAGVGIAFKIMSLLYEQVGLQLPDKVYELLALGTIADVVPLKDENRFWVQHGLSHINRNQSLFFQVLKKNNNVQKPILNALDIGFSIAPQINALGRLADPRQAVSFLIGSDPALVSAIGNTLFELNEARKRTERIVLTDIEGAIQQKQIDLEHENIIIAGHTDWPIGVIGLVASRLVSLYGKPTLLFHCGKDGYARGSGRSIAGFNLFEALKENKDIITQFGGHAAAAGLSLPIDKIPLLKQRLEEKIVCMLSPEDLQQKLLLDAEIALHDLTPQFVGELARLEPFGNENEQPLFYIKNVAQTQSPLILKDQHVKCQVGVGDTVKTIIFFNRPDLYERLDTLGSRPFDCAAYTNENYWNGKTSIELQGVDIT